MYQIRLQDFEGPLDLLLFFIQRDELDIHDIPIARIADEYLSYVKVLQQIDLDGAGDFIYMASVLISIKARMLLPRPVLDERGEEVDPRQELVDRLLEYTRYKEAARDLEVQHARRSALFTRGEASSERARIAGEEEVTYRVSVFDLISALERVMREAPETALHQVSRLEYSVENQQDFVLGRLAVQGRMSFSDFVRRQPRGFVIATFLAILELLRSQRIIVTQHASLADFYLQGVNSLN